MVMQKSIMKYMTRIGQKTGTLKASKKVQTMATIIPFVAECLKTNKLKKNHQDLFDNFDLISGSGIAVFCSQCQRDLVKTSQKA